jgi:hypothetical protein
MLGILLNNICIELGIRKGIIPRWWRPQDASQGGRGFSELLGTFRLHLLKKSVPATIRCLALLDKPKVSR